MWLKISEKTFNQVIDDQISEAEMYRELIQKSIKNRDYYNGIVLAKLDTVSLLIAIKKSMLLCTENENE